MIFQGLLPASPPARPLWPPSTALPRRLHPRGPPSAGGGARAADESVEDGGLPWPGHELVGWTCCGGLRHHQLVNGRSSGFQNGGTLVPYVWPYFVLIFSYIGFI